MANLELIKDKSTREEIEDEVEEIQLPLFDITIHDDETWFQNMIKEINEMIKQNDTTKH